MRIMQLFILVLASLVVFSGCNNSKITEADLPSNQKMLSLCVTPWEQMVSEDAKLIAYMSDTAACNQACKPVEFTCKGGKFIPGANVPAGTTIANVKQFCKQETKCGCQLPEDKGRVSDGFTTKVFSTAQVACGQVCSSVEKEVICKNGQFFEFADQTKLVTNYNFSCAIEDCKSCTAPWNTNLRAVHGGRLIGFVKDKLTCGFTCSDTATNAIGFTCNNGELVRDTGALATTATSLKTTCEEATNCTCKLATGETYSHDKAAVIKLTKKQTGTCDVACDAPVDYTCEEGKFVNKATKAIETAPLYKSCSDTCKYCTFPNGETVKQGTTKEFFKNTEGTCSVACQAIMLRCDAGATQGEIKIVSGTGPIEDYRKTSCSDTCVTCKLPDGTNLLENAEKEVFTKGTAACNETCVQGKVKCDKATGNLKLISGPGVLADYTTTKCVDNCIKCTMPDGSKVDAPAYNLKRYTSTSVACGQSCDINMEVFHCNPDGSLVRSSPPRSTLPTANFIHTACEPEKCKDCDLPWSSGTKLNNGSTTLVYPAGTVACGQRCENTAVEFRCTDSNLIVTSGTPLPNLASMKTSCQNPASCPKCVFAGRDFMEGEKVVGYRNNGSEGCSTGACTDYKTLTCKSGQWEGADPVVYKYSSCSAQCTTSNPSETGRQPGDQSAESGGAFTWLCPVLHSRGFAWEGTTLSYYSKAKVACGDSCNKYRVEVKCDSTSGLFNNTANPNSVQMLYMNCKDECQ